jgi:hypothetical protein
MKLPRLFHTTLALALVVAGQVGTVEAGDRLFRKKARPVRETVTTVRPEDQVAPTPMLGSFRPTPYVTIGSNPILGGGYGREYSPLIYGPTSAFRSYAAPVTTVVRGYDGVPAVVEGTAFSYPNLPALSPYVYPTRANNYTALPYQRTSPSLDRGGMWIDHN